MNDIVERLRNFDSSKFDGWACMEEAADEILRLRTENEKLREQYDAGVAAWNPVYEIVLNERDALKAENEKLRAALRPFAEAVKDEHNWKYDINVDDFRAAAAALKETGDE